MFVGHAVLLHTLPNGKEPHDVTVPLGNVCVAEVRRSGRLRRHTYGTEEEGRPELMNDTFSDFTMSVAIDVKPEALT